MFNKSSTIYGINFIVENDIVLIIFFTQYKLFEIVHFFKTLFEEYNRSYHFIRAVDG